MDITSVTIMITTGGVYTRENEFLLSSCMHRVPEIFKSFWQNYLARCISVKFLVNNS